MASPSDCRRLLSSVLGLGTVLLLGGAPGFAAGQQVDVSGCWTGSFSGWQNGTVPVMKVIQNENQLNISGGLDKDGDNTIDVPFGNVTSDSGGVVQLPVIEVGRNLYGRLKLLGDVGGRGVWLKGKTNLIVIRTTTADQVTRHLEATRMSWLMVTSTLEKISARLTVYPDRNVSVSIDPATVTLLPGQSTTFMDTVTGPSNTAVVWAVEEAGCGNVTQDGVYTAPDSPATCHVTITSVANPCENSTATVTAAAADLSIVKTDSPDPVAAGGTLTYTIRVTNAGPSSTGVITMTDQLPPEVTFMSAYGLGPNNHNWQCGESSGVVTCTWDDLGSGGAAPDITITVTAPGSPTTLTNTATVSSATPDPNTSNNSATETTTVNP